MTRRTRRTVESEAEEETAAAPGVADHTELASLFVEKMKESLAAAKAKRLAFSSGGGSSCCISDEVVMLDSLSQTQRYENSCCTVFGHQFALCFTFQRSSKRGVSLNLLSAKCCLSHSFCCSCCGLAFPYYIFLLLYSQYYNGTRTTAGDFFLTCTCRPSF